MKQKNAYDAVSTEAHREARSIIAGLVTEIEGGYIKDEEALDEAIHAAVDDALIYTSDQWLFAWGLPDADDIDNLEICGSFGQVLARRAYCNLREYVAQSGATDFKEAMQVAEDKAMEKAGV